MTEDRGESQRPLERILERAERRDEALDDITTVAPTLESESVGDVARGAGEYLGDVLDGMGGAAGSGLEVIGRGIADLGNGLQRIGQKIAGGSNPWDAETSSGGDDCEDDGPENGGSDENGGGGPTSDDPEFVFDLNLHIQWSTDADAAQGPVLLPLDDGGVAGGAGGGQGLVIGGEATFGVGPATLDGGHDDILG